MLKKIFLMLGLVISAPTFVAAAATVITHLDVCLETDVDKKPQKITHCWMHYAACYGHEQCTQALITNGADVNTIDEKGKTPLHYAASNNRPEIIKLLIQHGANVNAQDNDGNTPLHLALAYNSYNTVLKLLKKNSDVTKNADVTIKNTAGQTPLDVALTTDKIAHYIHEDSTEEKDRADLVAQLIKAGVEIPQEHENKAAVKDAHKVVENWQEIAQFEFRTNLAYIAGGALSAIGIPLVGYQVNKEYKTAQLDVVAENNKKHVTMRTGELRIATLKRMWQNIKAKRFKNNKTLLVGATATGLGLGTVLGTWILKKVKGY